MRCDQHDCQTCTGPENVPRTKHIKTQARKYNAQCLSYENWHKVLQSYHASRKRRRVVIQDSVLVIVLPCLLLRNGLVLSFVGWQRGQEQPCHPHVLWGFLRGDCAVEILQTKHHCCRQDKSLSPTNHSRCKLGADGIFSLQRKKKNRGGLFFE